MQPNDEAIYEGEWVIAMSAAGKFIGKLKPDTNSPDYPRGVRLEPVYDVVMVQIQQNGVPAIQRQLMPILLIPVDIGLTLDKDVGLLRLSDFPRAERDAWFEMLRNARAGMQQLRAQRSGLVIPGR